jgi:type II secretion system protein H
MALLAPFLDLDLAATKRLQESQMGRLAGRFQAGFTLIELILVMAILTMAVSVTAPTLAHFFRGRTLDSEARRLLALTRNGQNRAVSEGIPMNLWVNSSAGTVGLDAEPSFETDDPRAVEFAIDSGLQLEVLRQPLASSLATNTSRIQPISTASVAPVKLTHPNLPTIRFLPDGTVGDNSPQSLRLTGRDGVSLLVALAPDRLSYEIRHSDK